MQHLAGSKIQRFRKAQSPKMSRRSFGATHGGNASPGTVQGWEDEGKRPRDPAVTRQIAAAGIARHEDWTLPARCPSCELPADDASAAACRERNCPLAIRAVA